MKNDESLINDFEIKLDNKSNSRNTSKLFAGFKKNKVVNEVLDRTTVMTMYKMINSHIISYVNGVVSAGKESVVFWAVKDNVNIALKTYLTSTSNFKKRASYITGDPRFTHVKKNTRSLVYQWAKKEFKNLHRCQSFGISVPAPLYVDKNVLAMDFIGDGGVPAKTLVQCDVNKNDYNSMIELIDILYNKAHLIHADLSGYNVFKTNNGLVLFDLGSAVDTRHPNAMSLLERDINNVSSFFVKRGLQVTNPIDVIKEVTL
ncbi:MAG: serine protein kinase RIO [Candidatus Nitrosoabyssus spongiisocia]|nr:MAG: serine protein kinase RIO [Nitrosopumilaceae archaeon AB1(1)]